MTNDKRRYETTIIVNGALEEDTITQVVDQTAEFITRNGGEIAETDHWGRKRLAYPINKKHTGYYVQFTIDAPAELLPQMERYFHLEEHIIRHLSLKLEESDLRKRELLRQQLEAEAEAAEEEEENKDRNDDND